jgi:hypothetical protein
VCFFCLFVIRCAGPGIGYGTRGSANLDVLSTGESENSNKQNEQEAQFEARINGEKEQRIPEVFSLEGEVQTSHDEI